MSTQILIRRGLFASLPTGSSGEPLWTTDTKTLYISDGAATNRVLMAGTGIIVNADVNASAAIARSKLASGTADHVVINSGAGAFSSEANLAVSRGGTGAGTLTANNVILGNGTSAVQFVAPSTSGNVLTSNGTTWTSAAPASSGPTVKVVGSAETRTSTTLSASSTLTTSPTWGATTKYAVFGVLIFSNANATPDADFQFNGPNVTTLNIGYQVQRTGGTSIVDQQVITSFVTGGTGGQLVNLTAGVTHIVTFSGGFITTGSPGSNPFAVEFAQNVGDGVNATSLLTGSFFYLSAAN